MQALGTSSAGPASPVWPVAIIGVGLALGQVWGGLYDLSVWGPVALVVAACLVALLVSRPGRPTANALVVLGALIGLAGLSAVSMLWAESAPQASLEAHRWALYAGLFAVLLLVLRDERQSRALLISVGVASTAVVIGMTLVLAAGDASELFLSMRLMEPFGYVNGQAAALAVTLWPALALAERARHVALRGAGAGVACLVAGLLLLVQSRGAMLALVAALAFVLIVIPGRLRRGWLVLFVAAATAVVAGELLGVYSSPASPVAHPADAVVHSAVRLLLAASVACGMAWSSATWLAGSGRIPAQLVRTVARWAMVAILACGAIGALAVVGDPIAKVRSEVQRFTALDNGELTQSRLLAGGGNRYDYWRVAVDEFRDAPILGVGAGNYPRDYFRLRGTPEDIRQPHSIELQALSELGVAGLALVLALISGLLWGCVRAARGIREGRLNAAVVVTASGLIVSWIVHTSVDWLHLLPSLTGVMICAAAAVMATPAPRTPTARPRLVAVIAGVGITLLAAAGIGRITLAAKLRDDARSALTADPAQAKRLANRALGLQGGDAQTLYVLAAAYAREDDYANARRTLLRAVDAEPHNFVPHALLGDLAMRRGDVAAARASYRAAIALNPRDTSLKAALNRAR